MYAAKINNAISATAAADFIAPDWPVKNPPQAMRTLVKIL